MGVGGVGESGGGGGGVLPPRHPRGGSHDQASADDPGVSSRAHTLDGGGGVGPENEVSGLRIIGGGGRSRGGSGGGEADSGATRRANYMSPAFTRQSSDDSQSVSWCSDHYNSSGGSSCGSALNAAVGGSSYDRSAAAAVAVGGVAPGAMAAAVAAAAAAAASAGAGAAASAGAGAAASTGAAPGGAAGGGEGGAVRAAGAGRRAAEEGMDTTLPPAQGGTGARDRTGSASSSSSWAEKRSGAGRG